MPACALFFQTLLRRGGCCAIRVFCNDGFQRSAGALGIAQLLLAGRNTDQSIGRARILRPPVKGHHAVNVNGSPQSRWAVKALPPSSMRSAPSRCRGVFLPKASKAAADSFSLLALKRLAAASYSRFGGRIGGFSSGIVRSRMAPETPCKCRRWLDLQTC